jgi:peptidoglycan hydrolase-like protein with peptidoglycan-binding domain
MTEDAVSRFQRANKLKVDGVAGPSTLQRMFSSSAAEYSLYPNDEGNDVVTLQKRLAELNYFNQEATGYYGSYTEQAVSDFQKRNSLTVDGVAGPKTLDKLYSPDAKEASSASSASSSSSSTKPKETKKASSSNNDADAAVALALSKVGCRYVWSTEGPNTFDCSGLVYYMLKNSGVSVSRLNAAGFAQESSWDKITSIGDLKKGDLVFFRSPSSSRICHVAIYIGNGQIVHAATSKTGVKVSDLSSYYQNNFVLGRRPNY